LNQTQTTLKHLIHRYKNKLYFL